MAGRLTISGGIPHVQLRERRPGAAGLRDHPSIGPKMWIQLCYRRIPEGLIEHLESGSIIGNVVLDNRTGR